MEEQVAVEDLVEAALGVEEADVILQLLAAQEGGGELVDDRVLLGGEGVGVLGVYGGEVHILQGIGGVSNGDALALVVDLVQQQPVAHAILGMAQQLLALQLEEDDGDRLVHPGGEELVLLTVLVGVGAGELDSKAVNVAVLIYLVGKDGQGAQGDAVACLNHFQVVVVDGVGQHGGHQGAGAGGGAHPENVVVAPLDVHAVVVQQRVHDDVSPGTAVKDIAYNVHVVHGHALDDGGDRFDKAVGLLQVDDGGDDVFKVVPLVGLGVVGVDEFVNDVGVILGQGFAHLGAGILGGDKAADLNEPVQGDPVPLIHVLHLAVELFQLLLRIVDEGGQLVPLSLGDGGGKQVVYLLPDDAGTGVENM